MGRNRSSDPRKGLQSSLGCWVLPTNAMNICKWQIQHPCVGTENDGGFSPGYALLSFQSLTPSRSQPKADDPDWNKVTPTPCMQTGENLLYKWDWLKIGSARRREINQNTLNSRLALMWAIHRSFTHWMEWGGCHPNVNLRPRVVFDTQVWLQASGWVWRSYPCRRYYA